MRNMLFEEKTSLLFQKPQQKATSELFMEKYQPEEVTASSQLHSEVKNSTPSRRKETNIADKIVNMPGETNKETLKNSPEKRIRRKSFIDLERSHQTKVHLMIRNQIRKMSLYDENEESDKGLVNICSSLIYVKKESQWQNR